MVQLQVFFFPIMAHGHMIPILDMAKLFASRGVHSTIITTPLNAPAFAKGVQKSIDLGFQMSVKILEFPKLDGLPEDCENIDQIPSPAMLPLFLAATWMLKEQLEPLLQECHPNCLVADLFFPWATDSAARFNIPRLIFHGSSFFASCAEEQVRLHRPFKNLINDSDEFFVPNLPHKVKLFLSQIPPYLREERETEFAKVLTEALESERSHGVIVNSFYELESEYADYYRNVLNRRAWHIGPLSLCNRSFEEKVQRGKQAAITEDECLTWLNSKSPNSVVYICFGSVGKFPSKQLHEIAMGLEASEQQFIWVVMKGTDDIESEDWMPEEFEERMKGKGLIIRGWAPQVLILDHKAIGGFVTHCGWNSTLEGIAAGVPMVTWPLGAEQFYNEKLITDVLHIGVPVGAKEWGVMVGGGNIKRDAVETAVRGILVGEEAEDRRNRCKGLKEMAKKAIEQGGSSYSDLNALIQELSL
ncbi:hypothetical protein AgCh_030298 [Apium graveolens]